MNPRVANVICHNDYSLSLVFSNGETRHFDAAPYLAYPAFQLLRNVPYFLQGKVAHGTVVWPNEEDFCPDTLYLESKPVAGSEGSRAA